MFSMNAGLFLDWRSWRLYQAEMNVDSHVVSLWKSVRWLGGKEVLKRKWEVGWKSPIVFGEAERLRRLSIEV